LGTDTSKSVS